MFAIRILILNSVTTMPKFIILLFFFYSPYNNLWLMQLNIIYEPFAPLRINLYILDINDRFRSSNIPVINSRLSYIAQMHKTLFFRSFIKVTARLVA
jgi:hypothetical protein